MKCCLIGTLQKMRSYKASWCKRLSISVTKFVNRVGPDALLPRSANFELFNWLRTLEGFRALWIRNNCISSFFPKNPNFLESSKSVDAWLNHWRVQLKEDSLLYLIKLGFKLCTYLNENITRAHSPRDQRFWVVCKWPSYCFTLLLAWWCNSSGYSIQLWKKNFF